MADKKDAFYLELTRDLGYKGVHLGKGFVLESSEDPAWAEHLVTMGDAKKVDKPDHAIERPWVEALKERQEAEAAAKADRTAKHPTAPMAYADAKKK